jgi:hypothetical protein
MVAVKSKEGKGNAEALQSSLSKFAADINI